MKAKRTIVKRGVSLFSVALITLSIAAAGGVCIPLDSNSQCSNGDVELYIRGGFGYHIGVINHGNDTVTAYFNVTSSKFERTGSFDVPPYIGIENWDIIFIVTLIKVNLTADGETLARTGFIILGFTIFLPSEIEHE